MARNATALENKLFHDSEGVPHNVDPWENHKHFANIGTADARGRGVEQALESFDCQLKALGYQLVHFNTMGDFYAWVIEKLPPTAAPGTSHDAQSIERCVG